LGNRPATSRKYYVHPAILEAYQEGTLLPLLELQTEQTASQSPWALDALESTLMLILRRLMFSTSEKW
jgi:DNA topoisomerase I